MAGTVTFKVSLRAKNHQVTDARFDGTTWHGTTNRMKLAEAVFEQELAASEEIDFCVGDDKFFALNVAALGEQDATSVDVVVDNLYDLVTIENITHRALQPLDGIYNSVDRALLRRARLLWEGKIVPFRLSPLTTTAPAGVVPQVIVMAATTVSIGGTELPTPVTLIRHPLMTPKSILTLPNSEPPADEIVMTISVAEPFLAWAPEKCTVNSDDDLAAPAPWDLSHFDEQPFLGRPDADM